MDPKIASFDSHRLAKLMQLDSDTTHWQAADAQALLSHQWSAPLEAELVAFDTDASRLFEEFEASDSTVPGTFADLLIDDEPPLAMLILVKRYAKQQGRSGQLPKQVAGLIYAAAIAIALVRCDERITELDDASLIERFQWASDQTISGPELRALFDAALTCLRR